MRDATWSVASCPSRGTLEAEVEAVTIAPTRSAAAERVVEAATRLAAVRARLERLQRGEPCTAEDVAAARRLAVAQAASLELARERLLHTHRSSAARLREQLERRSSERPRRSSAVAPAVREGPATEAETARLRSAVVAILSAGGGLDADETTGRTAWSEKLVEQCRAADWRGWARTICAILASDFPQVRGAAVCVIGDEGAELVAASDPWTARLQELELLSGEGPSTTAQQTARTVTVDDFAAERERWQGYASATYEHDVHSIVALPLRVAGMHAGVLTVYGRTAAPDGPVDQRVASAFAGMAATALLFDRHGASDEVMDGDWFRFYVATGATAARFGIGVDEAEARLRAHAFSAGLTLAQVAELALSDRLALD